MRLLVEATFERDEPDDEGNPVFMKDRYLLHHWGIEYRFVAGAEGQPVPVYFTVGICEHVGTGQIETFLPKDLRVIGKQIKE